MRMTGVGMGAAVARPVRGPAAAVLLTLATMACADRAPSASGPGEVTLSADSASNPTVAFAAAEGTAYAAWVGKEEGRNAVFVAALGPDGALSPPVRANDIPGDAAPHLQAPAQVAVGPDGAIYVLWQNNTPIEGRRFPASDLRLAVSTDGGRSFRPAITVNDDAGGPPSSHTFHDMVVADDGTVYVSWIDSRERDAAAHQQEMMGGAHGHHATAGAPMAGAMGAAAAVHQPHAMADAASVAAGQEAIAASHDHGSMAMPDGPDIRVARSTDGGRTFTSSVVVDSAACPCCRTSLALGPDGAVYIAWRKIFPGDVRDVVVARADAGPGELRFAAPVRVHRDEWVFPGCPHAGPSLAVDRNGRLLVGWYTGKEGRQGLWYAVSEDGGRTFGSPSAVLTEEWVPPSQLRLAVADQRLWAVWDDRTGDQPLIRVASGPVGADLEPSDRLTRTGGDPSLAVLGDRAAIAWLDGATARLMTPGRSR